MGHNFSGAPDTFLEARESFKNINLGDHFFVKKHFFSNSDQGPLKQMDGIALNGRMV
jgi:hypothetical protein